MRAGIRQWLGSVVRNLLTRRMVPAVALLAALAVGIAGAGGGLLSDAGAVRGQPRHPSIRDYFAARSVRAGLDGGRQAALRRRRQYDSPAGRRARRGSRTRYRNLSDATALLTLRRTLPGLFGYNRLGQPHLAQGVHVERYLRGNTAAQLAGGRAHGGLLLSTTPLRSATGTGRSLPVDDDLITRGTVVEPRNPLASLVIHRAARDGFTSPNEGIAVAPATTSASPPTLIGNNAIFPNAERDTDFVDAVTPSGVEAFSVLRSASSPNRLAWQLTLPPGAKLQLNGDSSPSAGPPNPSPLTR